MPKRRPFQGAGAIPKYLAVLCLGAFLVFILNLSQDVVNKKFENDQILTKMEQLETAQATLMENIKQLSLGSVQMAQDNPVQIQVEAQVQEPEIVESVLLPEDPIPAIQPEIPISVAGLAIPEESISNSSPDYSSSYLNAPINKVMSDTGGQATIGGFAAPPVPVVEQPVVLSELSLTSDMSVQANSEQIQAAEQAVVPIEQEIPQAVQRPVIPVQHSTAHNYAAGQDVPKFMTTDLANSGHPTLEYIDFKEYTVEELPMVAPVPYNRNFIFHTKLPKAGGTTMLELLRLLSTKNMFYFGKIETRKGVNASPLSGEEEVIEWYNKTLNYVADQRRFDGKVFLLKHHYPFDFSKYGLAQPTYINVIRDPVTWFQSRYYFERNGWSMGSNQRLSFHGTEQERNEDINSCLANNSPTCAVIKWTYFEFICGNLCPNTKSLKAKRNFDFSTSLKMSKLALLQTTYTVGILEEFQNTLTLFEKMMPDYFDGAVQISTSPEVLNYISNTKSVNVTKLTEENKEALKRGKLKYETDFYQFTRAVFHRQLKQFGII